MENRDARAIRAFFGNLYKNIAAFHGHNGTRFVYKHPLIQYKILDGTAVLVRVEDGAYLLKAIPDLHSLQSYNESMPVISRSLTNPLVTLALPINPSHYSFTTPWIALNEHNYATYLDIKEDTDAVGLLLKRILIGNLLSMAKALGYVVDDEIQLRVAAEPCEFLESKAKLPLLGFVGDFW